MCDENLSFNFGFTGTVEVMRRTIREGGYTLEWKVDLPDVTFDGFELTRTIFHPDSLLVAEVQFIKRIISK